MSKTYYRTNEQGVQEPIYVPPVESQPKQPEIEKVKTPNDDFVVFDGVSTQDVVSLLKHQKLELAQNATEPYPTGEDIDESLKAPYLNIWNPPEAGISPAGIEFILSWEGLREYPYNDLEDPLKATCTVGYGHTLHAGSCSETEMNHKYDQNELLDFLVNDVSQAEKDVRTVLQKLDNMYRPDAAEGNPLPVTQEQFDALVSIVYTSGYTNFETLIMDVITKDNEGGYYIIDRNLFETELKSKFTVIGTGLVNRRNQEVDLFYNSIYGIGP